MKVINLFGGPSSGKSTTAAGLYYFMKMRHQSVELVTEVAKEHVYDGTLDMMLDRQEVIFANQNQRLHRLQGHVEYAIIDSPLLLSCVYCDMNALQRGVDGWPAMESFKRFVLDVYSSYDNINIFITRPTNFEDGGRAHNLEESLEIDKKIIETLHFNSIPYSTMLATEHLAQDLARLLCEKSLN